MAGLLEVKVDPGDPDTGALWLVRDILADGGVGVIPTDTVYGLVARAVDPVAVERLARIKDRPPEKPFPVLVAGVSELVGLGVDYDERHVAMMEEFWPGGLTIILKRRADLMLPLQRKGTIAVRVPDHPVALWLLRTAGPLVAPSANPAGGAAPVTPREVDDDLRPLVDFIVCAGTCPGGRESTVVDATGKIRILREGAVAREELDAVIEEGVG